MTKVFDREQAMRMLPLVRVILRDLDLRWRQLRWALQAREAGDAEAQLRIPKIRRELLRHRAELEALGCCVSRGQPVALFPATQGGQLGFFRMRPGGRKLDEWAPVDSAPVERLGRSASGARRERQ